MFRQLLRTLGSNRDDSTGSDSIENPHSNSFAHFTDAVDTITQLKRERRHDEAETLLLWCIDQAKQDSDFSDPPPWYYKHLAIVYRKDDRYEDEVHILERYLSEAASPHKDLQDRLQRANELAETEVRQVVSSCTMGTGINRWFKFHSGLITTNRASRVQLDNYLSAERPFSTDSELSG